MPRNPTMAQVIALRAKTSGKPLPVPVVRRKRGEGRIGQSKVYAAWRAAMEALPGIWLPIRTVNPLNGTTDRWGKVKRAKKHRLTARVAVNREIMRRITSNEKSPNSLRVMLTRYGPQRMDDEGVIASLKAVRDGISDAAGVDDGDEYWDWKYDQQRSPAGCWGVRIQLLPLGDSNAL